jgi:hypothetical protein
MRIGDRFAIWLLASSILRWREGIDKEPLYRSSFRHLSSDIERTAELPTIGSMRRNPSWHIHARPDIDEFIVMK